MVPASGSWGSLKYDDAAAESSLEWSLPLSEQRGVVGWEELSSFCFFFSFLLLRRESNLDSPDDDLAVDSEEAASWLGALSLSSRESKEERPSLPLLSRSAEPDRERPKRLGGGFRLLDDVAGRI